MRLIKTTGRVWRPVSYVSVLALAGLAVLAHRNDARANPDPGPFSLSVQQLFDYACQPGQKVSTAAVKYEIQRRCGFDKKGEKETCTKAESGGDPFACITCTKKPNTKYDCDTQDMPTELTVTGTIEGLFWDVEGSVKVTVLVKIWKWVRRAETTIKQNVAADGGRYISEAGTGHLSAEFTYESGGSITFFGGFKFYDAEEHRECTASVTEKGYDVTDTGACYDGDICKRKDEVCDDTSDEEPAAECCPPYKCCYTGEGAGSIYRCCEDPESP